MNPYAYDFSIFNEGMNKLGSALGDYSVRKQMQDYLKKLYGAQDAAASANRDLANAPGETPEIPGGGSSPVYDVKQYNDARANPLAGLLNPGNNPDNTAAANAALMAAKSAPENNSQMGANPQIDANRAVLQQKADEMNRQASEAGRLPANPLVARGILQNQQANQALKDLYLKNRFLNVMNDPSSTPEQKRSAAMSMLTPEGYLANTMITPKERMMLEMEFKKAGQNVVMLDPENPNDKTLYEFRVNPITGEKTKLGVSGQNQTHEDALAQQKIANDLREQQIQMLSQLAKVRGEVTWKGVDRTPNSPTFGKQVLYAGSKMGDPDQHVISTDVDQKVIPASDAMRMANMMSAKENLDVIRNAVQAGVSGRVSGRVQNWGAWLGIGDNAVKYRNAVEHVRGIAGSLYRNVSSDQADKILDRMLPHPDDPADVAVNKLNLLEQSMGNAFNSVYSKYENNGYQIDEDLANGRSLFGRGGNAQTGATTNQTGGNTRGGKPLAQGLTFTPTDVNSYAVRYRLTPAQARQHFLDNGATEAK